jgi:hypothetical protein
VKWSSKELDQVREGNPHVRVWSDAKLREYLNRRPDSVNKDLKRKLRKRP